MIEMHPRLIEACRPRRMYWTPYHPKNYLKDWELEIGTLNLFMVLRGDRLGSALPVNSHPAWKAAQELASLPIDLPASMKGQKETLGTLAESYSPARFLHLISEGLAPEAILKYIPLQTWAHALAETENVYIRGR